MINSVSSRLFSSACGGIRDFASAHWKKGALAVGLVALTALGYAIYNDQIVQECLYPTPVCPETPPPSIHRDWYCYEFVDNIIDCAVVTEAEKPSCTIPSTVCTKAFSQLSTYLPYVMSKISGPLKAFAMTTGSIVFSVGCMAHFLTKDRPSGLESSPSPVLSNVLSEVSESDQGILGIAEESGDKSDLFALVDSMLPSLSDLESSPSPEPDLIARAKLNYAQQDDTQLGKRHVLQEKVHSYEESKKVALDMLRLDLELDVVKEKKICEKRFWKNPEEFFANALKSGSVIVPITHPDKTVGAYFVVLDKIDVENKTVSIRDPYQGKAIILSFDVFFSLSQPHGYKFIGVAR